MTERERALRFRSSTLGLELSKVRQRRLAILVVVLLAITATGVLVDLSVNTDLYQQDLQTYYFAGKAHAAGLDPYDITVLSELAQMPVSHPFVYPPSTLALFQLFGVVDFSTAYYLFLAAKAIALLGLLYLWKREFLPRMDPLFILFALVAYNAALYVDFRVGNIAVFEGLLIWTAFAFLLRGKSLHFGLVILAAASFKIAPILFLGLLLLSSDAKKYTYLAACLSLFAVTQILTYLASPSLYLAFLGNLGGLDERGVINPSTVALMRDASDWLAGISGVAIPETLQEGVFVGASVVVGLATWRSLNHLQRVRWPDSGRVAIFLTCLAYALVLPRFKTYSYLILLLPTYFILMGGAAPLPSASLGRIARKYGPLVFFTVFSSLYLLSLGSDAILHSVFSYSSLIVAFAAWVWYLRRISDAGGPGGAWVPFLDP